MSAAGAAQTRLLHVIEALAGNEVTGLTLAGVVEAMAFDGAAPSTTLRDLETLEAAGWAHRVPGTKRWALAARPIQILFHFQSGLARAKQRVAEVEANYNRMPLL
jgi:DNA-binding IclR family transcriptional regulator